MSNVELQTIQPTDSIAFQTANGMVEANQIAKVYVHEVRPSIWALVHPVSIIDGSTLQAARFYLHAKRR